MDKLFIQADQLLRDNKVSNASMYRNLDAEIRASIRQLVSPIEIKQLIEGQLTEGTDYIEAVKNSVSCN